MNNDNEDAAAAAAADDDADADDDDVLFRGQVWFLWFIVGVDVWTAVLYHWQMSYSESISLFIVLINIY